MAGHAGVAAFQIGQSSPGQTSCRPCSQPGNSSTVTFDAAGQVTEETDFAGQVTRRITYDRDDRVLTQQDGVGNTVAFVYGEPHSGSGDWPIAIRYPTFIQTTQYDACNRPIAVTTPMPAFNINATSALITRYEYTFRAHKL